MWGVFKIVLFLVILVIATLLSGIISVAVLWLLDVFATLRTTLWWAELWGVVEPL